MRWREEWQWRSNNAVDVFCPSLHVGYVNVTSGDEDALRLAIVKHGPISVAIDASHKSLSFYANGVYYEKECGKTSIQMAHSALSCSTFCICFGGTHNLIIPMITNIITVCTGNKEDQLDHAVLAVGYGTLGKEPFWLIKNSWSTYWGNDGYVLMSRKDNNCGVATTPTYVTI